MIFVCVDSLERERILSENEIELKVQNARLADFKREFRSLHRTLKKMKPTPEIATLLSEEIDRYNGLTKNLQELTLDRLSSIASFKQ